MAPPKPRRAMLPTREEYGPPAGDRSPSEQLPWTTASRWLADARYYWLATVRRDGRPYSAPIWAVWLDETMYFTTSPETATARNIAFRPDAVVHTESGSEVVIVEGRARRLTAEEVPVEVVDAYEAKYGWRLDPADAGMPYYALEPVVARTWLSADLRETAACWDFVPREL